VYSSPEEAPGHPVDYRTDIFSLGVVMFEMLTGRLPFDASSSADAVAPVPSSVNRALPPELDPIVTKALARNAADRYTSAATMAAELRSVGGILDVRSDAQLAATPFVPVPQGRSSAGRWFLIVLVLAALAAAAYSILTRV
jgi:serine/threonine protein kinase